MAATAVAAAAAAVAVAAAAVDQAPGRALRSLC